MVLGHGSDWAEACQSIVAADRFRFPILQFPKTSGQLVVFVPRFVVFGQHVVEVQRQALQLVGF